MALQSKSSRAGGSAKVTSSSGSIKPGDKIDIHGVTRSRCTNCSECPQFVSVAGHVLCAYCGCPPAKHEKVDRKRGRESESGGLECPSCDSDHMSETDTDNEESSSGVSSYSGHSRHRHRQKLDKQEQWTWRPKHQITAPPPRVSSLLEGGAVEREIQLQHTWSEHDHSPNIYIKADDPLTFHRNPVYQTTDAIRGKGGEDGGYTSGLHVWEVTWPADFRGTHPVVGVANRDCPLTEPGYKRIVGSNTNSWGWCLKSLKIYHDTRKYKNGLSYPRDIDEKLKVPTTFYMILDCDRGTLSFQVDNDFLGVAFSGLRGEELFPVVSAVWGHCEVTLTYIGNHFNDASSDD